MSVVENTGVMALGHIAVIGSPAGTSTRVARARDARVVVLGHPGQTSAGLAAAADRIANLFRLSLTRVTTGLSRLESALAELLTDPADMSSVGHPPHLVSSVGHSPQSAGARRVGAS
jgi:hypothetical protein